MTVTRRKASVVVLIAAAWLYGCWSKEAEYDRYSAPISEAAAALLPRLNEHPQELPSDVGTGGVVVMLLVGLDPDGRVLIDGDPIVVAPSSLRLGRAVTERRTAPPRGWAMIREANAQDVVRYWIPLDPEALVRASIASGPEEGHSPHLERVPDMWVTLRMPYFPEATLEFVRRDGSGAGSYRFAAKPDQPLQELE